MSDLYQNGKIVRERSLTDTQIKDQPLDRQVGGGHYKGMAIQPIEFAQKNKLNYCESNAIKYICRHANKNGVEDLRKAIHNIELLIQIEYGDK